MTRPATVFAICAVASAAVVAPASAEESLPGGQGLFGRADAPAARTAGPACDDAAAVAGRIAALEARLSALEEAGRTPDVPLYTGAIDRVATVADRAMRSLFVIVRNARRDLMARLS